MKKILIILLSIVVLFFVSVVIINNLSRDKFANKYGKKNLESIDVYYGDSKYYVIKYKENNDRYISVINEKKQELYKINEQELKVIKKKNLVLGYKDNKLIYEEKEKNKYGFIYYYYNALNGEFIKKISVNK